MRTIVALALALTLTGLGCAKLQEWLNLSEGDRKACYEAAFSGPFEPFPYAAQADDPEIKAQAEKIQRTRGMGFRMDEKDKLVRICRSKGWRGNDRHWGGR